MYSPSTIHKTFAAVKGVNDCLALQQQGEPVLMAFARQGEAVRKQLLANIWLNIAALCQFLHLKNTLSDDEKDFIAEEILEEFGGTLTMADFHVVLRNAKAGRYGKMYERISAPDVLEWFRKYWDARLDAAERFNYRRAQEDKVTGANLVSAIRHDPDLMQGIETIIGRVPTVSKKEIEAEYQAYRQQLANTNYQLPENEKKQPNQ